MNHKAHTHEKNPSKAMDKTKGNTTDKTSWGNVAEWYDDLIEKEGTYQREVVLPNLLRLLAPAKVDTILDIACGQGFFSREIANAVEKAQGVGHGKVIGFDISAELIQVAKAKERSPKGIEYHVSPSHLMPFCKDASIDKAIIILALQNIEQFQATLAECARVLKEKGKLILVLNHPAFRIPHASSWGWDEAQSKQYRRLDAYMSESKEKILMNPGERDVSKQEFTVSFHRPLQVYFKALEKAGLVVVRLEEWISHKESNPAGRGKEENRMRKEIPMFLALEIVKRGK